MGRAPIWRENKVKVKVKVEEINGIMSEGEGEGENRKQGGREGLGNGKWKVESGKESGNLELAGADATHNTQHTTHNNTQQHTTHNNTQQSGPNGTRRSTTHRPNW